MEILCFVAGVVFIYLKTAYAALFMLIVLFFRTKRAYLFGFIAGCLWGFCHQWMISPQWSLPDVLPRAKIQGYITSIPSHSVTKTQFQLFAEQLDQQPTNIRLLLSCFKQCPEFKVGQYWQLTAKLKKPLNYSNPGSFDYAGNLSARHIDYVGYIRPNSAVLRPSQPAYSRLSLREYLAEMLAIIIPEQEILGIIQALTLGLTQHIDKSEWDLFRKTGTTHLMVISGAHIGLVAGLVYAGVKWLWSCVPVFCLRYPAPKVASVVAWLLALTYALLAGFGVPAQRALIVCFFMFFRHFCHQRFSAWQAWRYALLIVLLFEPHSVRFPGFYLSFLAVAILIITNERISWTGFRKIMALQMACAFGLMPLTLYWFSYGSINGLLANLFAIPWVSFVIVPMGLLLLLLGNGFLIPGFLWVLKQSVIILMTYLRWIDSLNAINIEYSFINAIIPIMLMLLMGLLLVLPIKPVIFSGMILIIASSVSAQKKIKPGSAEIHVLDVGQGLAVVVQTAKHVLMYDTGIQYYQGSDSGKMVIIPYLDTLGVHSLDKIVISHPDLDHRGGLVSLEKKYSVQTLIVDDPAFYHKGKPCHQYPQWQWDGVSFRFFPILIPLNRKNNSSCVLQISTRQQKMLLTGDIEKQAEEYLVKTYGRRLASTIMIIPHHGSKTSSSQDFVSAVAPRYAVVSYGFDNRYHFPHQKAMQTYQKQHIPVYNTLQCGMVSILLDNKYPFNQPHCYREKSAFWSHRWLTKY